MPNIDRLGPLEKPPDLIRKIHKFYQKQTPDALKHDSDIVDFRSRDPRNTTLYFEPIDPNVNKPITISQFLNRKLRWLTLGGQYDWTKKEYPKDDAPPFPQDIAALITAIFQDMRPEAAIVNVYTSGDTLGIHRDVSENSDKGLVSVSLGCDGIFVAGLENPDGSIKSVTVRLRSGDAVYMSGRARFAWHRVPQILPGTCPTWLRSWPAAPSTAHPSISATDRFEAWRDWMVSKRVNLNVRQMWD
ncbi:MAG: hypothetical protein Q9190_005745 [Brigantiaea leucoxantha]